MTAIIIGEINTSVKKAKCRYCEKTIFKQRKRIDCIDISVHKSYYPSSYSLHIDCYLEEQKKALEILKNHIKQIKKKVTKEYLEQKNKDLLLEAL